MRDENRAGCRRNIAPRPNSPMVSRPPPAAAPSQTDHRHLVGRCLRLRAHCRARWRITPAYSLQVTDDVSPAWYDIYLFPGPKALPDLEAATGVLREGEPLMDVEYTGTAEAGNSAAPDAPTLEATGGHEEY